MTARHRQSLFIALACLVGCVAFAAPAAAQFRDFFRAPWRSAPSAPSYNPFYPQPQVYEPTRPPPPHKVETPPSETIVVVGDQLAEWLAYGLEEVFADTPEVGVVRKIKFNAGLVRYEARADAPEWPQAIADILAAEKPSAIVVMLGINDRLPLRDHVPEKDDKEKDKKSKAGASQGQAAAPAAQASSEAAQPDTEQAQAAAIAAPETQRRSPNGYYEFHGDKWAELYAKRIDEMIAALKAKGAPVLWVGLPAVRGTKSTSDMSYLDDLYRARAEKAGITYVDVWDGFVDERGLFTIQGPDFEGQIRRLRTGDGVNFTKYGAEKLARYVEHDLRRVLTNHVVPVALPGPEEQPKGVARPAIGPVVPLSTLGNAESGDLLGANSHPAQREIRSDCNARIEQRRADSGAGRPRRRFFLAAGGRECKQRARPNPAAKRIAGTDGAAQGRARQERGEKEREDPTDQAARSTQHWSAAASAAAGWFRGKQRAQQILKRVLSAASWRFQVCLARGASLFWRSVVKRGAFIDDVHGQKLQRFVAHDFEASVRHLAFVDVAGSGCKLQLLAIGQFDGRALKHIKRLLAMMDVAGDGFSRLIFSDRKNDLHIGAGQVGAL